MGDCFFKPKRRRALKDRRCKDAVYNEVKCSKCWYFRALCSQRNMIHISINQGQIFLFLEFNGTEIYYLVSASNKDG